MSSFNTSIHDDNNNDINEDNESEYSEIKSFTPSYIGIRLNKDINDVKIQAGQLSLVQSYDIPKVIFPFQKNNSFWCKIEPVGSDSMKIWLESKSDKKQWNLIINDLELSKYTNDTSSRLPLHVVAEYLSNSLTQCDSSSSSDITLLWKSDKDAKEYLILKLQIDISKIWKVYYTFELVPVEVDDIAKIYSCLRDANASIKQLETELKSARDEISRLQVSTRIHWVSLRHVRAIQDKRGWNRFRIDVGINNTSMKHSDPVFFEVVEDGRGNKVLRDGLYLIHLNANADSHLNNFTVYINSIENSFQFTRIQYQLCFSDYYNFDQGDIIFFGSGEQNEGIPHNATLNFRMNSV